MKQIVLLGSTGSIGDSTLDIVAKFPDQFSILGLAARHSDEKLEEQIRSFRPKFVGPCRFRRGRNDSVLA